jgi:hypothetical protein
VRNAIKAKKASTGCQFCTDPDFALRHTLEDDALLRIAEIANELFTHFGWNSSEHRQRLWEALEYFRDLDSVEAQQKRAIKALEAIEQDLS